VRPFNQLSPVAYTRLAAVVDSLSPLPAETGMR
jgi:hypothetical protein